VLAPCPVGWGFKTEETVDIAKEAVDVGVWRLREYENGDWKTNREPSRPQDLQYYTKRQARFKIDKKYQEEQNNVKE
jgi:pyruvate ferredoxin oxidoreductase beta subunit